MLQSLKFKIFKTWVNIVTSTKTDPRLYYDIHIYIFNIRGPTSNLLILRWSTIYSYMNDNIFSALCFSVLHTVYFGCAIVTRTGSRGPCLGRHFSGKMFMYKKKMFDVRGGKNYNSPMFVLTLAPGLVVTKSISISSHV